MSDQRSIADAMFSLKKPCENCPFLKDGAIDLAPGRVDGIIENLVTDDWSHFQCHKTVHHPKTGGEWVDTNEGSQYVSSGREAMCAGAVIYLEKLGRPNVPMRMGRMIGVYQPDKLMVHADLVIDVPSRSGSVDNAALEQKADVDSVDSPFQR
jgi:hypothetical protein